MVVTHLALGLALGAGIGGLVFGGLAWTLRRLATSRSPGRLVAASLLVRLAAAAAAVLVAVTTGGSAVVGLVLGLLAVRTALVRHLAPDPSEA